MLSMSRDWARGEHLIRPPSTFGQQNDTTQKLKASHDQGRKRFTPSWQNRGPAWRAWEGDTPPPIPEHLKSDDWIDQHIGTLQQPDQKNLFPQNGKKDASQTEQTTDQKQGAKPLDPAKEKKKLAWISPLDMLDYLGLAIDVVERAYIEMGMKPGQEKEFARFANTLYFVIDAAMAILPGAGGGGLALRATHEVGELAWHALPASSKAKVIQELAKKMGWPAVKASQAVNVFFSMKAGKGDGKDGKGSGKDSQGGRVGRPSGSIKPTKGHFKGKKVDYIDNGKHSKLSRLTQEELEKAVKDPKNKQKIVKEFQKAIKGKGDAKNFGSQLNKKAFQRYEELIREGLENGKRTGQGIEHDAGFNIGIDVVTGKATSRYLIYGAPHGAHIIPIP